MKSLFLDHPVLIWCLLFLFGCYIGLTGGYIQTDEAWFLQVVDRILNGEIPYRDIYFGITPLSLYLTYSLALVFGAELFVIRLIMAGSFALMCWLTYRAALKLNLGHKTSLLIVLCLAAFLPYDLRNGTPYTSIAYLFLMAVFYTFLSWQASLDEAKPTRYSYLHLFMAGSFTALGFASKQSIGMYTAAAFFLALLAVIFETKPAMREVLSSLAISGIGFLLTTVIVSLPVILTGSMQRFLEYGFLNKGIYIEVVQPFSFRQILQISQILGGMPLSYRLLIGYASQVFVIPVLSFGALFLMVVKRKAANIGVAVGVISFTIAATLGLFPNTSVSHIVNALPMLLIGFAFALTQIGYHQLGNARSIIRSGLMIWLIAGIVLLAAFTMRGLSAGEFVFSDIPHFRGLLLNKVFLSEIRESSARLSRITGGKPTFLFMQTASLYYLSAHLLNPTPYDLPLYPALGVDGEDEIIAAIESRKITNVCYDPLGNHSRKPIQLEKFILKSMHKAGDAGLCSLYQLGIQ